MIRLENSQRLYNVKTSFISRRRSKLLNSFPLISLLNNNEQRFNVAAKTTMFKCL